MTDAAAHSGPSGLPASSRRLKSVSAIMRGEKAPLGATGAGSGAHPAAPPPSRYGTRGADKRGRSGSEISDSEVTGGEVPAAKRSRKALEEEEAAAKAKAEEAARLAEEKLAAAAAAKADADKATAAKAAYEAERAKPAEMLARLEKRIEALEKVRAARAAPRAARQPPTLQHPE